MKDFLAFGIGCFHFGVAKKPPFVFRQSQYLEELRKSLSSINNLDKLTIRKLDDEYGHELKISEPTENLRNSEGIFPDLDFLEIEFNLYLPYRIQDELATLGRGNPRTFTERFHIRIVYTYHLPVCIISLIDPTGEPDPSDSIQIVREFLDKEIGLQENDYIRFEFLGPSPFHANFFMIPASPSGTDDWDFVVEHASLRGYDRLEIGFNTSKFPDSRTALEAFSHEIADEFGFVYNAVLRRNQRMRTWSDIEEIMTELTAIQNGRWFSNIPKRLSFEKGRLVSKIFATTTEFEVNSIFSQTGQNESYNQIFGADMTPFFKTLIDSELSNPIVYPTAKITELLKFFEGRRQKSVEFIVLLISAVLGGAVGALLTSVFNA